LQIAEKIYAADQEAVYSWHAHAQPDQPVQVAAIIRPGPHKSSRHRTRGSSRADHCVVNAKDKTITIGASTSRPVVSNETQASSLAKTVLAIETAIASPDHPYHGYKLRPFLFIGGLMPTTGSEPEGKAQYVGRDMLDSMGSKDWSKERRAEVLQAVGMVPYLSYFADAHASPLVSKLVRRANTHVAGADTFSLYEQMRRLDHLNPEPPRAFAKVVLGELHRVAEVLASPDVAIGVEAPGKGHLLQVMSTVTSALYCHFLNFPVEAGQKVDSAEKLLIVGVAESLERIASKAKTTLESRQQLKRIAELAARFPNAERVDHEAMADGRWALPVTVQHDLARQSELDQQHPTLTTEKIAALITKAFIDQSPYWVNRLAHVAVAIDEKLGHPHPKGYAKLHLERHMELLATSVRTPGGDWAEDTAGYSSRSNYLTSRQKFLDQKGSPTARGFVRHTAAFLEKTGKARQPESVRDAAIKSLAKWVGELVDYNPQHWAWKELTAPRSVSKTTPAKSSTSRRRPG
jgi:hypothetical protein